VQGVEGLGFRNLGYGALNLSWLTMTGASSSAARDGVPLSGLNLDIVEGRGELKNDMQKIFFSSLPPSLPPSLNVCLS
jgi:hypothetical protein